MKNILYKNHIQVILEVVNNILRKPQLRGSAGPGKILFENARVRKKYSLKIYVQASMGP